MRKNWRSDHGNKNHPFPPTENIVNVRVFLLFSKKSFLFSNDEDRPMSNVSRSFSLIFPLFFFVVTFACSDDSSPAQTGDGDTELSDSDFSETEQDEEEAIGEGLPSRPDVAPTMIVRPEDKAVILERIEREPFKQILDEIKSTAARDHYDFPEPDTFDKQEQANGEIAQANAFLAWLLDDETYAAKAREFLQKLSDNYASHKDSDINIRMPSIVMCYTFALDLLVGAEMIPENEAEEAETKLTTIIDAFYADYIENDFNRIFIHYTQNNHPIRTACSIGTVALGFPEHPEARKWADWAFSELSYLWGPNGQYVQEDGGVSEGSLYYRFAFGASLAMFHAWHNRIGEPRTFTKNCINRIDEDPWTGHGCVDGESFVFKNPMFEEPFQKSVDWFLTLRMPDGRRPPMEDSGLKDGNGGAVMARYMDREDLVWDWHTDNLNMSGGMDLRILHLAYAPEIPDAQPPAWTHRVMETAGQAVFRSGWGEEDFWLMVTAEHGSARKTIHDHVDGGSFTMSAYGEYLLIDCGYYKPNSMNNAVTAQAASHNLLTIEEEPVEPKGMITNFGDADAFLKNEVLSDSLAYVEAWQDLDVTQTQRSVMLVRNRYAVVADRILTPVTEPRHHTWRLHGYAGHGTGEYFGLGTNFGVWEREKAGVKVYLATTAEAIEIKEPRYTEFEPPHVHEIEGDESNHGVMDGNVEAVAPGFLAVAAPYKMNAADGSSEAPLSVEEITANGLTQGVAAWEVTHSGGKDLVLLRVPDAPTELTLSNGKTLATDAEFVLVTLEGNETLTLMARGTTLSLDGNELLTATDEAVVVSQAK